MFSLENRAHLWQWIIALVGPGTPRNASNQVVCHLHASLGRGKSGPRLPDEIDYLLVFGYFVLRNT